MGPGFRRKSQNCNARKFNRVVSEWIGKIEIQANQSAPITLALLDQVVIECRMKPLVWNCADIVTGRFKRLACRFSQVFVELELQTASSIGIGTNRSRAISDP